LYLFSLLKIHRNFNWKSSIFFIISASIVLHMDFSYTYVSLMLTLLFIVFLGLNNFKFLFRASNKTAVAWNGFVLVSKFVGKLIFLALMVILVNISLIWTIVKSVIIAPQIAPSASDVGIQPINYLFSQTARILSYLIPSSANPILGGLAKSLEGSFLYGRGPIEQTLYLGWIPIMLVWFAWRNRQRAYTDYQQEQFSDSYYTKMFFFLTIGGILFSFPPYLNLGIFKIYFPSFFMYKLFPMFRAYARFGLIAIMSVSVLAGIGLKYLLSNKTPKRAIAITSIVVCLILFEFNNIPPFRVTEINNVPAVYKWLVQQKGDFIIAEYPIRVGDRSEGYVNLDYLLYQRYHEKSLVNGAKPGTDAFVLKQRIVNILNPETPAILSSLGVKYVLVHAEEYKQNREEGSVEVIGEIPDLSNSKGLRFAQRFGDVDVYEVIALPIEVEELKNVKILSQ